MSEECTNYIDNLNNKLDQIAKEQLKKKLVNIAITVVGTAVTLAIAIVVTRKFEGTL